MKIVHALLLVFCSFFLVDHVLAFDGNVVYSKTFKFNYGGKRHKGANDHLLIDVVHFADKLYGYVFYAVSKTDGHGWIRMQTTNGVKHRGFHVCMEATFAGPEGKYTYRISYGVQPKGNRDEKYKFQVPPEFWAQVKTIRVEGGWCPSKPFGKAIGGFFKDLGQAFAYSANDKSTIEVTPPPPAEPSQNMVAVTYELVCEDNGTEMGNVHQSRFTADFANDTCDAAISDAEAWVNQSDQCTRRNNLEHMISYSQKATTGPCG